MASVALRSPSEKLGGLFYFARMLDKIRLHADEQLPQDYHANLGRGFDEKCTSFLRVDYDQLVQRVNRGGTDEEILQWCFDNGQRPSEDDVYVWNEFMRKRGWNDEVSEILERRKKEAGMFDRSDIQTAFQFIDADEGRLPPGVGTPRRPTFFHLLGQGIDSFGKAKIKLRQSAFAVGR